MKWKTIRFDCIFYTLYIIFYYQICHFSIHGVYVSYSSSYRIIALARERPKGISDKDLAIEIPDLQPVQRAQIINKLLSQGYFDLFKQAGLLFYRLKDPTKLAKCADNEEKIVYRIIEEAGNKGIWTRDIRFKSNLMHTQLQKILKSLETKKFIKVVKPVAASKKKVYMLYNLEPDESVTGGAWYQDQDFETEFVDVLNQQCYRFLEQKREKTKSCNAGPIAARNMTFASSKEVWKFISDLGISKVGNFHALKHFFFLFLRHLKLVTKAN